MGQDNRDILDDGLLAGLGLAPGAGDQQGRVRPVLRLEGSPEQMVQCLRDLAEALEHRHTELPPGRLWRMSVRFSDPLGVDYGDHKNQTNTAAAGV